MNPLLQLIELSRSARKAGSVEELAFLAVNDTRLLANYRQGALWFDDGGVKALSGVVELESNAPYTQWLDDVCRFLAPTHKVATGISAIQLPEALATAWADWLPPHGIWLPFTVNSKDSASGGLLLASDQPWQDATLPLLQEWCDTWHHAWQVLHKSRPWSGSSLKREVLALLVPARSAPWWKQRRTWAVGAILAVLLIPVRLSVLAPGELVPVNPAVIRASVDGVVGQFQVQPNQVVKAGQPLFGFDEASIAARYEVAAQALAASEAEYRQNAQQALSDAKSKAQLAILLGKIGERRAEADYFREQFERSKVVAPQDGIVLFDDPSEWIGKPVQTGERIMRIASPGDVEVEAWLPIGDAIPLPEQAEVHLYLAASPLSPLSARVRYVAHDAVLRPDGSYAYRLRAKLGGATDQRVGMKGTAKISGDRVPLIYWMLRRPLAAVRQAVGI